MRVNGSVFKSRFVLYQQSGFFFLASARIESSSTGSTLILPTEIYRLGRKQKRPRLGAKNVSLTRNVALSSQSSHYSVSCMSAPSISECRVVVQSEIHRAGALRLACGKLSPCQSLQRRGSMTKPKGQLHGCALFVKLFSR
jgi:hypothetical protein